jgi:hypothetical protein
MQTQITCPRCQAPFAAEVHQIIDVGRQPPLKELFLNGYLNVAQCPACGAVTRITTPMLYHDPEHELFMVHVPMELSLPYNEQERLIGDLVRQTMDSLPPEQRRGYMLQPQTVLSLQTFVEKVLETEGITQEVIARQRGQADLLNKLLAADREEVKALLREHNDEIDETFFAILRSQLDAAERGNQEAETLKLINLQAKLYQMTDYGRMLERQQQALKSFGREAQSKGLTPELLLKHVLANRADMDVVDALAAAGQQALNYEFFMQLSKKIEKREKSGVDAADYVAVRDHLLERQQVLEKQSREILQRAQETLEEIISAADTAAAVDANLDRIDDAFMYVLAATLAQAEERKLIDQVTVLTTVQELIMSRLEQQAPPEIRLLNDLLEVETEAERRQILDENAGMISPTLLQMVRSLRNEIGEAADNALLQERLAQVEAMLVARA